ncbi:glucuronyl hydrolase, partial [Pantoea sp. SIMBA_079]
LRQLAVLEDDPEAAARATEAADGILASLIADYTPEDEASDALILHGVYNLPGDHGVDEGNLWGDYFYLEALQRTVDPEWELYW